MKDKIKKTHPVSVSDFVSSFAFAKISNERQTENGMLLDELMLDILDLPEESKTDQRQRCIQAVA